MFKKLAAIFAALVIVVGAGALYVTNKSHTEVNSIEFAFYGKPGGGHDRSVAGLVDTINANGISANKNYFGSCGEAMAFLQANPNALMVTDSSTMNTQGVVSKWCPNPGDYNVELATIVSLSPVYLCTAPGKPKLTFDSIANSNATIGSVVTGTGTHAMQYMVNQLPNTGAKVIPYENSNPMKLAATAGDIDFFFNGSSAIDMIAQGSTCIAASGTPNFLNIPSISEIAGIDYPQFQLAFALMTGHPSEEVNKVLADAFATASFAEFLEGRKTVHYGIGSGASLEDQNKLMLQTHSAVKMFK